MFNRFLVKTLYKSSALKGTTLGLGRVAVAPANSLFNFNKMGFFDYSDNAIFSSDEEDAAERTLKKANQAQGQSEFFDAEAPRTDVHEGAFDPDDIPLYIYKMREEISRLRRGERDVPAYFPNFRRFVAMHHQNKERIAAEFPRSSVVFYEYCAQRRVRREAGFLETLENEIAEHSLQNMPIPGIKNFVRSAASLGRARPAVLDKLMEVLESRNAYNDIKANLIMLEDLLYLRYAIPEEYMLNSYKKFYEKLVGEGLFDPRERDMRRGFSSQITNGNMFGLISTTAKYLCENKETISFTEEEVKDFLERHSVKDEEGNVTYKPNETTNSVKDYILLTLCQEHVKSMRNGPLLKFFEVCLPEIFDNTPYMKDALLTRQNEASKRTENRQSFLKLRQHKNLASVLDEAGYSYHTFQKVGDFFAPLFLLEQENAIVEYQSLMD
eukprot:CAMPEP_0197002282 /NCGR_PEP_ID=MMETSP1380-20130617/6809_1 /TAXON_ID=5936 /ORGANISM="Euplotes crassus, Strain CT5" /LENGTH=439 /DNA_ID=CAMNT_0042420337 /DNA_START=13 /DNA_END=1332 /DNA_ORIENTATION=-